MQIKNVFSLHPGIRIDRIPVSGFTGLLFTLASLLVFLAVPVVREFLLIGIVGGLPTAAVLHFWHNQTRW